MIEWGRLRVLDAVARTGSVGRAAEALHMTSPAVSHHLRRIEAEVGSAVVEPAGRGVRLTPAGLVLASCAREVADLVQRAENDLDVPDAGTVRVAALASCVRAFVATALAAHRLRHPRVRVELVDGESVDHVAALRAGTVDLAVTASWNAAATGRPAGVVAEDLGDEPVLVALPAAWAEGVGSAVGGAGEVDLVDLADRPWTACPTGSDDQDALRQAGRAAGVEPDVRFEVADVVTQLALVAEGLAVALVPAGAAAQAEAGRVVLRRPAPDLRRCVRLLRRAEVSRRCVDEVADALRAAGRAWRDSA